MHWQPAMIGRLSRVRQMRMQLAEMELARADDALAASRQAEQEAQQQVEATTRQSEERVAEANESLLARQAGGRLGIQDWHAARTRARQAVQTVQEQAGDATSDRLGKELASSEARRHWRNLRLEVERMNLLREQMEAGPP